MFYYHHNPVLDFHHPSKIPWNICNHSQLPLSALGNPRTPPRSTPVLFFSSTASVNSPGSTRGLGFDNKTQEFCTGYFTFQLATHLRYWELTWQIAWMAEKKGENKQRKKYLFLWVLTGLKLGEGWKVILTSWSMCFLD